MKLFYALAFACAPVAANAATITLSGSDLRATEAMIDGEFGYQVDLKDLGFNLVHSITITDDRANVARGNALAGFNVDALAIGPAFDDAIGGMEYEFNAGGVAPASRLFGTTNSVDLDESFATLDEFDGALGPARGFLSLGNGGSLTAYYGRPLIVDYGDFLFIREVGANDRLGQIAINGQLPLPAGGLMLGSALALIGLRRKLR